MNKSEIKVPVITLDGPSGTGKGTLCHQLANYLGWHFLDSGAIYRVLAYALKQQQQIDFTDISSIVLKAKELDLRFLVDESSKTLVLLDGVEIGAKIRSEEVGQDASKIAVIPEVRRALLDRQRNFAKAPGLVTDGRDMGTVVFPDAELKIYLYASAAERAKRRYLQLKAEGNSVSLAEVEDELKLRDARDTARAHSPLVPAEDAIKVDTTGLTIAQVLESILYFVRGANLI